MLMHLRKFFPDSVAAVDEEGARRLIRTGIARSATYSIVSERDVCLFIDLMFALGPGFDSDNSMPWASAILRGPLQRASRRMDQLIEAAMAALREATSNVK